MKKQYLIFICNCPDTLNVGVEDLKVEKRLTGKSTSESGVLFILAGLQIDENQDIEVFESTTSTYYGYEMGELVKKNTPCCIYQEKE